MGQNSLYIKIKLILKNFLNLVGLGYYLTLTFHPVMTQKIKVY